MLRFRRDRAANTPSVSTGIGHRRCEPARPPRNALRRFTFVRHHDAPMASFRPALTETRQRNRPSTGRPVNSGPRPCLFDVGFPLSGLQDRTYTSDLNIRAQHTRLAATPLGSATMIAHPLAALSPAAPLRSDRSGRYLPPRPVSTTNSHSWWTDKRGPVRTTQATRSSDGSGLPVSFTRPFARLRTRTTGRWSPKRAARSVSM